MGERRVLTHWFKAGWKEEDALEGMERRMPEDCEPCSARGGASDFVKAVGGPTALYVGHHELSASVAPGHQGCRRPGDSRTLSQS